MGTLVEDVDSFKKALGGRPVFYYGVGHMLNDITAAQVSHMNYYEVVIILMVYCCWELLRNHVIQWFEVLDGLLGKHWRNLGLFFNCTFLLFGSVIQLIACASNIYCINDNLGKRTWTYIFGACCATTVVIPSFHNYRIWSFLGLVMTTYTAWYMTIASLLHGQVE